jgi:hypothetical protein
VSVTLPTGFVIHSATLATQPCTIDSANPHLASCTAAQITDLNSLGLQVDFVAPEVGTRTLTIEATCDNDADPSNNSATLTIDVLPNIDPRLSAAPAPERARTDVPVDLLFTIETNKYSLPDARLDFSWFAAIDEFSASAPGAACGSTPSGYHCEWPMLPANSSVTIAARVRSSVRVNASISAFLNTGGTDADFSNNGAFLTFPIFVPGDVGVSVSQSVVTATSGQYFAVPGIDVTVLSAVENPFIDLTFNPARFELAGLPDGSCQQLDTVVRCVIFGMQNPGTYHVDLQGTAQGVGSVPIGIRVSAANDFNTANDERMMTLTVVDPTSPPPPPSPPPTSGGGGGGGGGSMSWLLAALLLMMWHHRRARFRVHR